MHLWAIGPSMTSDALDPDRWGTLQDFMERTGYQFQRVELLDEALTHSSVCGEKSDEVRSNERMEFFGDAVLGFIVTKHLLRRFKEAAEGDLTKKRIESVKNAHLKEVAEKLDIIRYMRVGRSIESNAQRPERMAPAALEAVIAAIFMDGGECDAKTFIERFILNDAEISWRQL